MVAVDIPRQHENSREEAPHENFSICCMLTLVAKKKFNGSNDSKVGERAVLNSQVVNRISVVAYKTANRKRFTTFYITCESININPHPALSQFAR